MKKLVKRWILFVCGWFINLLFLWWVQALNFSIEQTEWYNLYDRVFFNTYWTYNQIIKPYSKNIFYWNSFDYLPLNFAFSSDYPFFYSYLDYPQQPLTSTGQNFKNFYTETTSYYTNWNNFISSNQFWANVLWNPYFSIGSDFSFWWDILYWVKYLSGDWWTYWLSTGWRYWWVVWQDFDWWSKQLLSSTASYRFFADSTLSILSWWLPKNFLVDSIQPTSYIRYTNTQSTYYWNWWSKDFYDVGQKWAHFLTHWNGYSYVSDHWDAFDNYTNRTDLTFGWRSSFPIGENMVWYSSFSWLQFYWFLILNPDWIKQRKGSTTNQTIVISKSNEYTKRLRVDVYWCKTSYLDDLLNKNTCPLIKKWRLKYVSSSKGYTSLSVENKEWNWYKRNTWLDVLPYSDHNSSFPLNINDWKLDFPQFASLVWRDDFIQDFTYDWQYLDFVGLVYENWMYALRYTIEEDWTIPISIAEQAEQWTLDVFTPLFSGWVVQTGEYVLPWQPWFVISGWVSVVDPNWTWFVESNLTWWFRAFYCPYDYGFVSLKLSDIPWLSLLAWSSIDFDLLKPISCMFSSFWQWVEEMKNNTFPSISFLSWWLVNQTWLMYSASSDSKNLFGVILDLILGALGVYLFIKRIK